MAGFSCAVMNETPIAVETLAHLTVYWQVIAAGGTGVRAKWKIAWWARL